MTKPECRMTNLRRAHYARLIFVGRLCQPRMLSGFTESLRLLAFGRLAGLNKQLQSIELFAEHGFYRWRNFLEAARNKSANAVGELEPGATGITS